MLLAALLLVVAGNAHAGFSQIELETFNNEPPIIKDLLIRAVEAERDEQNIQSEWQAAKLYCQASRLGSAEAQFRLGMLYAAGNGVPQNRDWAAAMFAAASMQGHHQSQKMLETIELGQLDQPPCVLAEVDPEKAPIAIPAVNASEIDAYIADLPEKKRWILHLVDTIASWYKVDAKLVLSVISVESNFEHTATSDQQAHGLMQLIPATAERFNVKNAYDASQNIKGGVAYLRWLLAYFEGDVSLAVAAYNAGEGAVNKYKGIPPYVETQQYVKKIQMRYPIRYHPFDVRITAPSPILRQRG